MKIGDTLRSFGGASHIPSKQTQFSQNFRQTSDRIVTRNENKMVSIGQSIDEKWIDESPSASYRLIRRNEDVRSERAFARSIRKEDLVPRQTRIQLRQDSFLTDSVYPTMGPSQEVFIFYKKKEVMKISG